MPSFEELCREQGDLFTRDQALAAGLTRQTLWRRAKPPGPWQRVIGNVYARFSGPLGEDQRRRAALLYAGPDALLAGPTACRLLALRATPPDPRVHVLLPGSAPPMSRDFVIVHRSARPGGTQQLVDGLPLCATARAVADTVRGLTDLSAARALLADAVQRRFTHVAALQRELDEGPRRGTFLLRTVLEEVTAGARSAPEAELLALIRRHNLPPPVLNDPIRLPNGDTLVPDFRWDRVLAEVDSKTWHLSPEDWQATMRRNNQLVTAGYTVLHFTPADIRRRPGQVIAEIRAAIAGQSAPARALG